MPGLLSSSQQSQFNNSGIYWVSPYKPGMVPGAGVQWWVSKYGPNLGELMVHPWGIFAQASLCLNRFSNTLAHLHSDFHWVKLKLPTGAKGVIAGGRVLLGELVGIFWAQRVLGERSACSYSQVWRGKGILGQDRKRKVHLLSADLIDLMQTINKKGRNRQATYAWWALPMWLSCSSPSVAQVQLRWMPSSVIYLWNYIALPEVTFYVYLISQIPTVEAEVTSSQMATFLTLIHINGREDEEKYL